MITIAIADSNQTYCQGLQVMLGQVEGFRVVTLTPAGFVREILNLPAICILLIDEDLYLADKNRIHEMEQQLPSLTTIVLTMDIKVPCRMTDSPFSIYKGAGKQEFATHIQKLTMSKQITMIE